MEETKHTEPAAAGGYNFGTFAGVYTPALLTILGLVMFMRTNFVLGSVGLFHMFLILLVGGSITLDGRDITHLSARELAKVRGDEISMIFVEEMTSLILVYTV